MRNNEMEKKAKDAALKYLSCRDRTRFEMKKHLEEKGFGEQDIIAAIDFLDSCNLLDDVNFCERYIRYGQEKGRGPLRIKQELLNKGIDRETVASGLQEHFGDRREREMALELAERLLTGKDKRNEKELARIARRLISQGYRYNVIYEVVGKVRKISIDTNDGNV